MGIIYEASGKVKEGRMKYDKENIIRIVFSMVCCLG